MGREEQIEEKEVLNSIFPEEITEISDEEYQITVLLDITSDDGEDFIPPTIILQVRYPENYPDEAPVLGLLAPPNTQFHEHFSVANDSPILMQSLSDTIKENLGMAMVFTLVSTLKESAENLICERQGASRAEHEERILAQEREENKKFHGDLVTPESFKSWREQFQQEMRDAERREEDEEAATEKKRNKGRDIELRLTGKQLWERGLVGRLEDSGSDDEEDVH